MKSAFHFDESQIQFGREVTGTLSAVRCSNSFVQSKVFTGSLLFCSAASEISYNRNVPTSRVNKGLFLELVNEWASYHPRRWCSLRLSAREVAVNGTIFSVCFETLDATTTASVDKKLRETFPNSYLGALEVDESLASHLGAYRLPVIGRIDDGCAKIYWDGTNEASKIEYLIDWFRDAGFCECDFRPLNGKYSIFDTDHGSKQSLQNAQSRQWMRELLDSVGDHILGHLADGAPALPEKLWNALNEFHHLKVPEQASNVAFACRRIFECVADALFPPTDEPVEGRDLGTDKYRNRLLMYLQKQKVSQSERSQIEATMKATALELGKLCDLANKGLHSEFVRSQARRCLLRTLLLLDSLVSVRQLPLEMQIRQDDNFNRTLKDSLDQELTR